MHVHVSMRHCMCECVRVDIYFSIQCQSKLLSQCQGHRTKARPKNSVTRLRTRSLISKQGLRTWLTGYYDRNKPKIAVTRSNSYL